MKLAFFDDFKLGIVTGHSLAQLCRRHFPRPLVYAMWIASEIAAMATDLAESLGAAIGLSLLFGLPLLTGLHLRQLFQVSAHLAHLFGEPAGRAGQVRIFQILEHFMTILDRVDIVQGSVEERL